MAAEIPEIWNCDFFELLGPVPVDPEQGIPMSVHERVLKTMSDMTERFALTGVEHRMPPPSMSTLGTLYTEIDFGRMN